MITFPWLSKKQTGSFRAVFLDRERIRPLKRPHFGSEAFLWRSVGVAVCPCCTSPPLPASVPTYAIDPLRLPTLWIRTGSQVSRLILTRDASRRSLDKKGSCDFSNGWREQRCVLFLHHFGRKRRRAECSGEVPSSCVPPPKRWRWCGWSHSFDVKHFSVFSAIEKNSALFPVSPGGIDVHLLGRFRALNRSCC